MVDKVGSYVLHRSAKFGEHPASLCGVRYRGLCRFVLAVVAIVRHNLPPCQWCTGSTMSIPRLLCCPYALVPARVVSLRCCNDIGTLPESAHICIHVFVI